MSGKDQTEFGGTMDVLSTAERAVYESLNIPMAIYDYVDGKVVTILVSDGL